MKEFKVQLAEPTRAEVFQKAVHDKISPAQIKQMDKLNDLDGFPTPPILKVDADQFQKKIRVAKMKWQVFTRSSS